MYLLVKAHPFVDRSGSCNFVTIYSHNLNALQLPFSEENAYGVNQLQCIVSIKEWNSFLGRQCQNVDRNSQL